MSPQSVAEETQAVELLTGARADRALLVVARAMGLSPAAEGSGLVKSSWRLTQLNHRPGAGVTGVFAVTLASPAPWLASHAALTEREALICLSTAALPQDTDVVTIDWNGQEFGAWPWPLDPWLPGLRTAATATSSLVATIGGRPVPVVYRPTRRAVLRLDSLDDADPLAFVKVVRPQQERNLLTRHTLLIDAKVPVPQPLGRSGDGAVAFSRLPGPTAAVVLRDKARSGSMSAHRPPARDLRANGLHTPWGLDLQPEHVLALLDRFPPEILELPQRASWSARVMDYTRSAATALPGEVDRVTSLTQNIQTALAALNGPDRTRVPTHGDFHPGNLILGPHPVDPVLGPVTGLLDLDSLGPGELCDDLACFAAHAWILSEDLNPGDPVAPWASRFTDVFGEVVDPLELRIRMAGVLVSLISVAGRRGKDIARRRLEMAESAFRDGSA